MSKSVGVSGLFSAGGMGLWHGVEYYEEEKLKTDPWKASWDEVKTAGLTKLSLLLYCVALT